LGQNAALLPGGGAYAVSFTFTLRLADEHGLGLELAPLGVAPFLTVQKVLPGGAMEAWNKQCLENDALNPKAVRPGDSIVSVNGHAECLAMLRQCRERQLLKITIARIVTGMLRSEVA